MKPTLFEFLSALQQNNNREWFAENKEAYETAKDQAFAFYESVANELAKIDDFSDLKWQEKVTT